MWTNPKAIELKRGLGLLYFIRVVDNGTGHEHRYIGQTTIGRRRLNAYGNNVNRIRRGLPRRITSGQEKYRAVHFALAKVIEKKWEFEFYPLKIVSIELLKIAEIECIEELDCDLNNLEGWLVEDYSKLTMAKILANNRKITGKREK